MVRHLRTDRIPPVELWGEPIAVADDRYVRIGGRSRGKGRRFTVLVCLGAEERRSVECVTVLTRRAEQGIDSAGISVWDVGDLDWDGEIEVMIELRYEVPSRSCCAGSVQYLVIDVEPRIRVAANVGLTDLDVSPEITLEDDDGDGHPNIVLRGEDFRGMEGEGPGRPYKRRYLMERAHRLVAGARGGKPAALTPAFALAAGSPRLFAP